MSDSQRCHQSMSTRPVLQISNSAASQITDNAKLRGDKLLCLLSLLSFWLLWNPYKLVVKCQNWLMTGIGWFEVWLCSDAADTDWATVQVPRLAWKLVFGSFWLPLRIIILWYSRDPLSHGSLNHPKIKCFRNIIENINLLNIFQFNSCSLYIKDFLKYSSQKIYWL